MEHNEITNFKCFEYGTQNVVAEYIRVNNDKYFENSNSK